MTRELGIEKAVLAALVTLFLLASCGRVAAPSAEGPTCGSLAIGDGAPRNVCYTTRNGLAFAEGDMLLGEAPAPSSAKGALVLKPSFMASFWPRGVVPYVITTGFQNPQMVTAAIARYTAQTGIRLVPRTTEQDYVVFTQADSGCYSMVGRVGGAQPINVEAACTVPGVIHEIGHAVGLFHEQTRADRDNFIVIHPENIEPDMVSQFEKEGSDSRDFGPYDYMSIMHYDSFAYSVNGKPTITKRDGSFIGWEDHTDLSPGDLAAIAALYPGATGIAPAPAPTPAPTPAPVVSGLVPLDSFLNPKNGDFATMANAAAKAALVTLGYTFVRHEGCVLAAAAAGTAPLRSYFVPAWHDRLTTARLDPNVLVLALGAQAIRTEGFVFASQVAGTVPLVLYWNGNRSDTFATATIAGATSARAAGYGMVETEGYVYPPERCVK